MPTIYDNIENVLADALRQVLPGARSADFCIGYFNLRGWGQVAHLVDEHLDGREGRHVRLLVGMSRPPEEEMRAQQAAIRRDERMDGPSAALLRERAARSFKEQIEFGIPAAQAEATLRQLARQLRQGQVKVKLFLRYPLHAKLYLVRRPDRVAPLVGYVGSSNLTLAGLSRQGELNVDVLDQDAAQKLQGWFDERWDDTWSVDITQELIELIETSWAREELVPPYLVYLKMIYHLSQDAREGGTAFRLPAAFQDLVLPFQEQAISMAVDRLHRHIKEDRPSGVLLGDVVGLGKTLMATAVAKIMADDLGFSTLVICPATLVDMWKGYLRRFVVPGEVLSLGRVTTDLPKLPRFRLLIIDESHNLRNREGRRYRVIRDYISENSCRCLLLTATPYNKQYQDVSNQLRLFLADQEDIGIRPEAFFRAWQEAGLNEADFRARFQVSPRSLRAFDQSDDPDDWRDLLHLYMIRRTRAFILETYGQTDEVRGRRYLEMNGRRLYFPVRQPHSVPFPVDESDPDDQYARLYRESVVAAIESLALPRYGLANYVVPNAERKASAEDRRILDNLNRAGRRLLGFARTNLFKRLESSGHSFLLSVRRHILRNLISIYALQNDLPLPIGTQDAGLMDPALEDREVETLPEDNGEPDPTDGQLASTDLETLRARAAQLYSVYSKQYRSRFSWISPSFFQGYLARDLEADVHRLLAVLQSAGEWRPDEDAKLKALWRLLAQQHPSEKVLVFTQFADTAEYLAEQLERLGVKDMAVAAGSLGAVPTVLARRFSPKSNGGLLRGETELRVLIATDVLAEGQNMQDSAIVVNYDLPWAIIRVIQRAGRVDRIGQENDTIHVYSFMPADGVERIIRLRRRLSRRLQENQEIIGSDDTFFGEKAAQELRDLYTERSRVLDAPEQDDTDLSSEALRVWNSASEEDRRRAQRLPPVIYATRPFQPTPTDPDGVLVYLSFPDRTDALVRVDAQGRTVSQSLSTILRTAACSPGTPALPRREDHHELTAAAVTQVVTEVSNLGGQLGSLRSVRRKVYEALLAYRRSRRDLGDDLGDLDRIINLLFRYPLQDSAREQLGRQLRLNLATADLLARAQELYAENRLVRITEEPAVQEPTVVCSLGLAPTPEPEGDE
ncbi:MAG: helicase-related protein [Anaerolineae bacterium]